MSVENDQQRFEARITEPLTHTTRAWFIWTALLVAVAAAGIGAYAVQLHNGLAATGMGDTVIWGVYISNFVFFSGVAMAGTFISGRPAHDRRRMASTPHQVLRADDGRGAGDVRDHAGGRHGPSGPALAPPGLWAARVAARLGHPCDPDLPCSQHHLPLPVSHSGRGVLAGPPRAERVANPRADLQPACRWAGMGFPASGGGWCSPATS